MARKDKDKNKTEDASPVLHNDLIQEVEDAVQKEELEHLWKEYGSYIIAGAIMAVLFTAVITGWRSWNEKTAMTQTAMIVEALEGENIPDTLADIAPKVRPGPRALAYFSAAALLLQDGKSDEAYARYEEAATDSGLAPLWRDLATIMAVKLATDQDEKSTVPDERLSRLRPIAENGKNIWTYQARLEMAQIMAHEKGQYQEASSYLSPILDAEDAPDSLKERAQALHHIYDIVESEQ